MFGFKSFNKELRTSKVIFKCFNEVMAKQCKWADSLCSRNIFVKTCEKGLGRLTNYLWLLGGGEKLDYIFLVETTGHLFECICVIDIFKHWCLLIKGQQTWTEWNDGVLYFVCHMSLLLKFESLIRVRWTSVENYSFYFKITEEYNDN